MDPTERMIRLYRHLLDQIGEATDIIEFDETTAKNPLHLPFVHIAIWDAKSDDDLTILHTLGMSEKYMNNADYLVELCWHIRGKISEDDKHHCSHFMANLTEYPYPLTDMETHMVADHGREEFVEFIEERKIDLFSDRSD